MKPGTIQPVDPETTLDYYVKRRNGQKRDYVYSYSQSRGCPHSKLQEVVIGSGFYRCSDCNYAFQILAAKQVPLHHVAVQAMQELLWFAKEFGSDSLQEVLRKPLGQHGGKAQRSALPEGKTIEETLALLESVDVTTEDGGAEQLRQLREEFWVSEKSRKRRLNELEGMDDERLTPGLRQYREELKHGGSQEALGEGPQREDGDAGRDVPGLQEAAGEDTPARDS